MTAEFHPFSDTRKPDCLTEEEYQTYLQADLRKRIPVYIHRVTETIFRWNVTSRMGVMTGTLEDLNQFLMDTQHIPQDGEQEVFRAALQHAVAIDEDLSAEIDNLLGGLL